MSEDPARSRERERSRGSAKWCSDIYAGCPPEPTAGRRELLSVGPRLTKRNADDGRKGPNGKRNGKMSAHLTDGVAPPQRSGPSCARWGDRSRRADRPGPRILEYWEGIERLIHQGKVTGMSGLRSGIYLSLLVMEFRREIVVVRPPAWFLRILAKLGRTFGFRLTL
jgi:hypothetical protein